MVDFKFTTCIVYILLFIPDYSKGHHLNFFQRISVLALVVVGVLSSLKKLIVNSNIYFRLRFGWGHALNMHLWLKNCVVSVYVEGEKIFYKSPTNSAAFCALQ